MIINIIVLIILLIILLYIINNSFNKFIFEKFIPHYKSENLILKNCVDNFAKDERHKKEYCYKHGFVTNPIILSGICGNDKKPLNIIKNKENIYYGCIGEKNKKIKWDLNDRQFTKYELTPYLGIGITNKNIYPSNLVMFLVADDYATVVANGKTYNHPSWNTFSTFVLPNINFNTEISCSITNSAGDGGFSLAYIWNGQLFIMGIHDFDSSINSIQFNENINNKVLINNWNSYIPNMPSFMYNWYELSQINVPQTISFNTGVVSNVANFMNNMTIFLAINGTGVVNLNSKSEYNYTTPNKLVNFNITNVLLGDKLIIDCKGTNINKGSPLLTIAFIYKGFIFVLNNKNKDNTDIIESSNIISCECTNWTKKYITNNALVTPSIMTGWLSSSDKKNNFTFSTYIGIK